MRKELYTQCASILYHIIIYCIVFYMKAKFEMRRKNSQIESEYTYMKASQGKIIVIIIIKEIKDWNANACFGFEKLG